MKRMKKWIALFACMGLMGSMLAACGSSAAESAASSAAAEAASEAEEVAEEAASEAEEAAEEATSAAESVAEEVAEEATSASAEEAVEIAADAGNVDVENLKVYVALGWLENESGWRTEDGYVETLLKYGVKEENITVADANYDVALQTEQLEAAIQTNPDVIFLMPASAEGLAEAVQHVVDAGIPIFLNDGVARGAEDIITGCVICDDYSKGYTTMEYLAEQLNYEGNVALIKLDPNPNWKLRSDAAKDVIAKYDGLNIVAEWSWDSTGVNTPRMAMDNFLAQFPNEGDLDAVWCAWDTAVMECLEACNAAGRNEIIFVGDNAAVEEVMVAIRDNPQFVGSVGSAFYYQAMTNVENAIKYLGGDTTTDFRMYTTDVFFDSDIIKNAESLMDPGENVLDYDFPGNIERWELPIITTYEAPEDSEAYGRIPFR